MKKLMNTRVKKTIRGYLGDWRLYTLMLPAVVYLFIFNYLPMYGAQIAFKDFRPGLGIWGSHWVGFKHFTRFITFPNFRLIMGNTARIGLYGLATFPCSVILALMINELTNLKFKKTVQMITYMPYFLSTVVVCSMILLFFNKDTGIVNALLESIGFQRASFMTEPQYFAHIYVWSGVWQGVGWGTIIYLAALSNVSSELVEAARVDGATRLKIIYHVNIPSILPSIIIMLILSCGGALSVEFNKAFLLQNPLNLSRSQVIATYVYEIGIRSTQFSYASAIGLFMTFLNVILLLVVNLAAKRISNISLW